MPSRRMDALTSDESLATELDVANMSKMGHDDDQQRWWQWPSWCLLTRPPPGRMDDMIARDSTKVVGSQRVNQACMLADGGGR